MDFGKGGKGGKNRNNKKEVLVWTKITSFSRHYSAWHETADTVFFSLYLSISDNQSLILKKKKFVVHSIASCPHLLNTQHSLVFSLSCSFLLTKAKAKFAHTCSEERGYEFDCIDDCDKEQYGGDSGGRQDNRGLNQLNVTV